MPVPFCRRLATSKSNSAAEPILAIRAEEIGHHFDPPHERGPYRLEVTPDADVRRGTATTRRFPIACASLGDVGECILAANEIRSEQRE